MLKKWTVRMLDILRPWHNRLVSFKCALLGADHKMLDFHWSRPQANEMV